MLSQPSSSTCSAVKSSGADAVGDSRNRQGPLSGRAGASECSHERAARSAPRPGAVSDTYAGWREGTRSPLFLDGEKGLRHPPGGGRGSTGGDTAERGGVRVVSAVRGPTGR